MRKPKPARYWSSNPVRIASTEPSGTSSALSVPSYFSATRCSMRMRSAGTPWSMHFGARGGCEPRVVGGEALHGGGVQPCLDCERLDDTDIGKPDAVGREHARQWMHEYRIHVEGIGDEAGVLSAGAAEARERVAADVVAALHGNLADGVRHVVDRDPQEPERQLGGVRGLAGGGTDIPGQLPEADGDARGVERQIAPIPEDVREELRAEASEHHVAIGQGERAAAAVRGRARHRARGFRADAQPCAVQPADRAAARGDRVDLQHR